MAKYSKDSDNSEDESDQSSDNDLEVIEALLARKYSRGRVKYKRKIPLIFFHVKKLVIL